MQRQSTFYREREHILADKGFAQVEVEAASAGPILCALGGVIEVGVGVGGGEGGTETVCPLLVVTSDGDLLLYHVLLLGASTPVSCFASRCLNPCIMFCF
jgi:hypothetical protein